MYLPDWYCGSDVLSSHSCTANFIVDILGLLISFYAACVVSQGVQSRATTKSFFSVIQPLDVLRLLLCITCLVEACAREVVFETYGRLVPEGICWTLITVVLCTEVLSLTTEGRFQCLFVGLKLVVSAWELYESVDKNDTEHLHNTLITFNIVATIARFLLWFTFTCINRSWDVLETERQYNSIPSEDPERKQVEGKKRTPEEHAGLLSRLCFAWLEPLMRKGYGKPLEESDFYRILERDESDVLAEKFGKAWKEVLLERKEKMQNDLLKRNAKVSDSYTALPSEADAKEEDKQGELMPVLKALHRAGILTPFYQAAVFKLGYDTLNFVSPQLLHATITFMNSDTAPEWHGVALAVGMLSSAAMQTFLLHVYFHKVFRAGMRVRSALLTAIYSKSLRLTPSARQERTVGQIVNLMSTDCARMQGLMPYLHITWSSPYVICLSMYFLWNQLQYAVFVAVGTILLVVTPLTSFVAKRIQQVQKEVMKAKDERIRVTSEAITSIKAIKMYGWEEAFREVINAARDEELRHLKRYVIWRAIGRTLWTATPVVVTLLTFGCYVLIQGGQLDSATAFTSLTLLNILRFPLAVLPNILNGAMEASVSLRRISGFFDAAELSTDDLIKDTDSAIEVKNGEFYWDDACKVQALHGINFSLKPGTLCIMTGEVGSGKSAMLQMLIRGLQPSCEHSPLVAIHGSTAYAHQVPWIQNASLRDNVLFGRAYDKEWYRRVIYACALMSDIAQLANGDATEIGERGINLSGGQKARVALARAVYSGADVLLLETCFEAVDEHVGAHLWKHCFKGILAEPNPITGKPRTVIVVTHALKHLPHADHIIVMRKGGILLQGTYKDLTDSTQPEIQSLLSSMDAQSEAKHTTQDDDTKSDAEAFENVRRNMSLLSAGEKDNKKDLTGSEERGVGNVSSEVYKQYIRAFGGWPVMLVILLGLTFKTAIDFCTSRWLAYWSQHSTKPATLMEYSSVAGVNVTKGFLASENFDMVRSTVDQFEVVKEGFDVLAKQPLVTGDEHEPSYYLGIYAVLSITSVAAITSLVLLLAMTALHASRELHKSLVRSVTRAPPSFFDTTPTGRILNRFTKDMYTIDEPLPGSMYSFLATSFGVLGTVFTIAYVTPTFLVAVPFLAIVYRYIQRYYIATSRELKRWDSVLRSPIYSHFTETLDGVSTIRAYGVESRFLSLNRTQLDKNLQAYYLSIAANRWLAVRLEFVGNFLVFAAALFVVIKKDSIDPSLAGLALSYALGITQTLNWTVRMVSELETNVVSVERVNEYVSVEPEAPSTTSLSLPSWPSTGTIVFKNLYARYRPDLDDVLCGLDITIQGGEKVGIAGRTGAGKSSLFLVMLRLVEPKSGSVLIDDVDTQKVGLDLLRAKLAIIPQDPVMFTGTLRRNMDPRGSFTDEQIWHALSLVKLDKHVKDLGKDTDVENALLVDIAEGGSNFSFGQRQLLCIGRAVLRQCKILLLDEATSGIDRTTDAAMQSTIQTEFKDCTVLTIAHRIETILQGDKVAVMDKGKIKEYGEPNELLKMKDSMFAALVNEMRSK